MYTNYRSYVSQPSTVFLNEGDLDRKRYFQRQLTIKNTHQSSYII